MHQDLFDDPVTQELLDALVAEGSSVLVNEVEEGKRKQPDPVAIVAAVCHLANTSDSSKSVAITLGANRAPIDAVRAIQNASSGRTGWLIAEYLHRMGHNVICIAGKTSANPSFELPDIRRDGTPDGMLRVCQQVANEFQPNVWIHAAAVLDYYTEAEDGKKASGVNNWSLNLSPGPKHIAELASLVEGSTRIGFKLESGVTPATVIERASDQIERYGVNAVIANIMEEMNDPNEIRARIVHADGTVEEASDDRALCEAINRLIKGQ
jgi:phosphopantothenoylcysteine synthetase/decarboxylase